MGNFSKARQSEDSSRKGVQTVEIDQAAIIGQEVYLPLTGCDPQQGGHRVVFSCSNRAVITLARQ